MTRSAAEVKKLFADRGLSISGWAKRRGFSQALVYQILSGDRNPVRGESYRIATALGLKAGCSGDYEDLEQQLNGDRIM